ncbi:GNAT family N-acetyltransferase [uncultured Roseibium sp.]|uniref:GNAT family N-acetyltransferase n=1 Tax=uncultured Roseibium sp. TaxID=1936171 RepID=UPI0032170527
MSESDLPAVGDLEPIVIDPVRPDDQLDAWRALAETAADPNPFFGPDFLIPFLEDMGPAHVRLCAIRDRRTGRWMMAAPMGRRRLGLGIPAATAWATEYGPLGTPLLDRTAPAETGQRFLELATRAVGLPLVAFPYLPLECAATQALEATSWQTREAHPEARAGHDGGVEGEKQFSKAFSGKRRKELPRLVRRLSEQGEVHLESFRKDDAVRLFETFMELEASGWKGKKKTALLNDPASTKFARRMIAARAKSDGVRIDSFSVDGKAIAVLVILLEGDHAFSWKIAFDEDYAHFSPGSQIALYALEKNLQDKQLKGADSLAVPGHRMIEPLWRGRIRYATLLCAASPAGRLLQLAGHLDLSLERDLRRLARRLLRH